MNFKQTISLICTAFAFLQTFAQEAESPQYTLKRVVIDAGHGGKDPGAVSRDRKTYEKNLVLDIAKLIGEKITDGYGGEVKVFFTRDKDVFVPLQDRADFANKMDADLFISVHINASAKSAPSGHSVHVLGQSRSGKDLKAGNLDVCKRENSVILLEDDYTTRYEGFDPSDEVSYICMTLMQDAFYEQSIFFASLAERSLETAPFAVRKGRVSQDPFYVLWKTSMPSVLLELGFISNDADLTMLRTSDGRGKIAESIYQAFREYKSYYDESMKLNR